MLLTVLKALQVSPKIWNSLPYHVKSAENVEPFTIVIDVWNGVSCYCVVCDLENIS